MKTPPLFPFPAMLGLAAGLVLVPRLAAQTSPDNWVPGSGWTLVWADEFNGGTLNPENWTYDLGGGGWGNNELETYTTLNATVQSGELRITAQKNSDGTYTSSRLKTQARQFWTYGKIAARLRLPKGQGIWPAFWMLGNSITTVGWPKCGEIDIMEMIGGGEDRDDSIYGTLHWDANGHASTGSGRLELVDPEIFNDDYHVFEIEWNTTSIAWKVDGVEFARSSTDTVLWPTMTEFHQPFFIVLNVAVGGTWPGSPDATTPFPQTMAVDWVRVYTNAALATLPAFATHPAGVTVSAGQAATFSVVASGNPAPTIQWQKNGADIPGATGDTYRIASATTADAANYRAVATNVQGSTTSNAATLTVTQPAPTPPPTSSGGGGGGAPSLFLPAALLLLAGTRFLRTIFRSVR